MVVLIFKYVQNVVKLSDYVKALLNWFYPQLCLSWRFKMSLIFNSLRVVVLILSFVQRSGANRYLFSNVWYTVGTWYFLKG